MVNLKLSI